MMLIQLISRQRCVLTRITTVDLACSRSIKSLSTPNQDLHSFHKETITDSGKLKPLTVIWKKYFSVSKKQYSYIRKDEYRLPDSNKRKKDKVPENFQIVYETDLTSNIVFSVLFPTAMILLVASIVFMSVIIFGYEIPDTHKDDLLYMTGGSVVLLYVVFLLPVVKLRNRGLVLRMYQDKTANEFIAFLSKNIFQTEKVTFKLKEAKGVLESKAKCNFMIKGRECQVYEKDFKKYGNTYLFNEWFGFKS